MIPVPQTHGNVKSFPGVRLNGMTVSSGLCMLTNNLQLAKTKCIETINYSFLVLHDCHLRVLPYRDLPNLANLILSH